MKFKILAVTLALVAMPLVAKAQQEQVSGQMQGPFVRDGIEKSVAFVPEITLEEALRIALSENPTIKVADLEVERQDYVRRETLGNLYPSLSATGNYSRTIIQQQMSRDGLSFGADNTITAAASLTVPLVVPAVYANLKLNRQQMEAAVEAARASKIDLANEVKKAYYGILLAEQSLEVLLASRDMVQQTVNNTKMMFDNELASEYDLLTAEVQLSNLQPSIIQTENSLAVARMMFRMLLGLPEDIEFTIAGSLDSSMDGVEARGVSLSTDVSDNSTLRTIEIQEQMLAQQIKLINSQRLPTIAAFGQASLTGNDMGDINFFSTDGSSMTPPNPADYPSLLPIYGDLNRWFGDMLGGLFGSNEPKEPATGFWWQNPVTVGVQVSIPIFSGNRYVNQVRQTRNSLAQLQLQRDYLEESLRVQAQSSVNNIIAAREKISSNEKTVTQAEKAYGISKVRYEGGAGTMLELNSSQLSLTQALLNRSQAVYDYLAAHADYDKTIGVTPVQ